MQARMSKDYTAGYTDACTAKVEQEAREKGGGWGVWLQHGDLPGTAYEEGCMVNELGRTKTRADQPFTFDKCTRYTPDRNIIIPKILVKLIGDFSTPR